jgi:hypothetical protein
MNRDGAFMKGLGAGMVAQGGVKLLGALAPGLGIGENESISDYQIEGAEDYALAGTDEMLSGGEKVSGVNSSYALAGVEMNTDMVG